MLDYYTVPGTLLDYRTLFNFCTLVSYEHSSEQYTDRNNAQILFRIGLI